MDWWTNFYHFGLVLNKLFNIVHAFSICVLCLSKLINYYKLKILFFLSGTQEIRSKKGFKKRGFGFMRHRMALTGGGQTTDDERGLIRI